MMNADINAGNNHATSNRLQSRIGTAKKIVAKIIKEITERNSAIPHRRPYSSIANSDSESNFDSEASTECISTGRIDAFVSSLPYYIPLDKAHASPNISLRCPCNELIQISDWSIGHQIDDDGNDGDGCTSGSFKSPTAFKAHLQHYVDNTDKCYLHEAVLAYYLSLESEDTDTTSESSTNVITNLNIPEVTRETDTLLSATTHFPLRIEKKDNLLCSIYFGNARTDHDTSLSVNHDGKNCWEEDTEKAKRAIASFKCLSIWLEGIQKKGDKLLSTEPKYIQYVLTIRISTCILLFFISNTSLQRSTSRSKLFQKTTNPCGNQPLPQRCVSF
jgi:hypothetical protein